MSVMMVLRMNGDPKRLQEFADANPDRLKSIAEASQRHGVIAHRFYGTESEVIVVDEWPDQQSSQSFFSEMGQQIGSLMQEVGVEGQPAPEYWHKLDTHDEIGWGA